MTRLRARVAKVGAGSGCGPAEWLRCWAAFERVALEGLALVEGGAVWRGDVRDMVRKVRQTYRPGLGAVELQAGMEGALGELYARLPRPVFECMLGHMAWGEA